MAIIKVAEITAEVRAALRHKGPTTEQLIKMLVSNDEKDMPSSRHVRWMARQILMGRNHEVRDGFLVKEDFRG